MEYMSSQPDNAFDLAIVDPPYGISIARNGGKIGKYGSTHKAKNWDLSPPETAYFRELKRVSNNQIIWGANHFIERVPFNSSCWIVWDKIQPAPNFSQCELAWTSFSGGVKMYKQSFNSEPQKIHPTQKPVKLYEWILTGFADSRMKVLDTHLGSGSSAIAAHYFGCDFVGCEIDLDYYQAAKKRFNKETAQIDLFY